MLDLSDFISNLLSFLCFFCLFISFFSFFAFLVPFVFSFFFSFASIFVSVFIFVYVFFNYFFVSCFHVLLRARVCFVLCCCVLFGWSCSQGKPQLGEHGGHASAEIARPRFFSAQVRQSWELPKVIYYYLCCPFVCYVFELYVRRTRYQVRTMYNCVALRCVVLWYVRKHDAVGPQCFLFFGFCCLSSCDS